MDDFKFVGGFFLIAFVFFAVITWGVIAMNEKHCNARWLDRNSSYTFWSGCLVEYQGTLVPEDRVWFERNK